MVTALPDGVWTARKLLERLKRHEKFFVLDVRNRDEFARFRIEGRERLPSVNVPYFERLELGGKDEMKDSIVAYAERDLREQLPKDRPVLAICAKGDTSEYVARGLCAVSDTRASASREACGPGAVTTPRAPSSRRRISPSTRSPARRAGA